MRDGGTPSCTEGRGTARRFFYAGLPVGMTGTREVLDL